MTKSGESPGLSRPICSGEAGTSQNQQGRQDEEGAVPDTPPVCPEHPTRDKCSSQVKLSQPRHSVSLSQLLLLP